MSMRLWSLHPQYLDTKGLLALWREGLLAQHVLLGKTKGYRNHPQLDRFKAHENPVGAIGYYLSEVVKEASRRGYKFNAEKLVQTSLVNPLSVTEGQMRFEKEHLSRKLAERDPLRRPVLLAKHLPDPHPMFVVCPGEIEAWERV